MDSSFLCVLVANFIGERVGIDPLLQEIIANRIGIIAERVNVDPPLQKIVARRINVDHLLQEIIANRIDIIARRVNGDPFLWKITAGRIVLRSFGLGVRSRGIIVMLLGWEIKEGRLKSGTPGPGKGSPGKRRRGICFILPVPVFHFQWYRIWGSVSFCSYKPGRRRRPERLRRPGWQRFGRICKKSVPKHRLPIQQSKWCL